MPKATPAEAVGAIEAARRAFDEGPWPQLSAKERSAILKRFAQALEKRSDALLDIAIRQNGSLIGLAKTMQVGRPIEQAHWFADRAATFSRVDEVKLDGLPFDTSLPYQRVRLIQRAPAGVVCAMGWALSFGVKALSKAIEVSTLTFWRLLALEFFIIYVRISEHKFAFSIFGN